MRNQQPSFHSCHAQSQQALFALILSRSAANIYLCQQLDSIRARTSATAVLTVNFGTHFAHYITIVVFHVRTREPRRRKTSHTTLCRYFYIEKERLRRRSEKWTKKEMLMFYHTPGRDGVRKEKKKGAKRKKRVFSFMSSVWEMKS